MADTRNFGEQLEELLTRTVSERVEVFLEDLAEDYVHDLVQKTVNDTLEDMDLCAEILGKIRAVDLERLVKVEVGVITVRLLKGQLTEIIEQHVRQAMMSDEVRSALISQVGARIRENMQSPDIVSALDQIAKQAVFSTLQRISMGLSITNPTGACPADNKLNAPPGAHQTTEHTSQDTTHLETVADGVSHV